MKKEHHAFENQIFHEYRQREKKIKKAIALLKENGYLIYEKKEI